MGRAHLQDLDYLIRDLKDILSNVTDERDDLRIEVERLNRELEDMTEIANGMQDTKVSLTLDRDRYKEKYEKLHRAAYHEDYCPECGEYVPDAEDRVLIDGCGWYCKDCIPGQAWCADDRCDDCLELSTDTEWCEAFGKDLCLKCRVKRYER